MSKPEVCKLNNNFGFIDTEDCVLLSRKVDIFCLISYLAGLLGWYYWEDVKIFCKRTNKNGESTKGKGVPDSKPTKQKGTKADSDKQKKKKQKQPESDVPKQNGVGIGRDEPKKPSRDESDKGKVKKEPDERRRQKGKGTESGRNGEAKPGTEKDIQPPRTDTDKKDKDGTQRFKPEPEDNRPKIPSKDSGSKSTKKENGKDSTNQPDKRGTHPPKDKPEDDRIKKPPKDDVDSGTESIRKETGKDSTNQPDKRGTHPPKDKPEDDRIKKPPKDDADSGTESTKKENGKDSTYQPDKHGTHPSKDKPEDDRPKRPPKDDVDSGAESTRKETGKDSTYQPDKHGTHPSKDKPEDDRIKKPPKDDVDTGTESTRKETGKDSINQPDKRGTSEDDRQKRPPKDDVDSGRESTRKETGKRETQPSKDKPKDDRIRKPEKDADGGRVKDKGNCHSEIYREFEKECERVRQGSKGTADADSNRESSNRDRGRKTSSDEIKNTKSKCEEICRELCTNYIKQKEEEKPSSRHFNSKEINKGGVGASVKKGCQEIDDCREEGSKPVCEEGKHRTDTHDHQREQSRQVEDRDREHSQPDGTKSTASIQKDKSQDNISDVCEQLTFSHEVRTESIRLTKLGCVKQLQKPQRDKERKDTQK